MTQRSTRSQVLGLLGWLALVMATGGLGAAASVDAASFYGQLNLPAWLLKVLVAGLVSLSMVYWLIPTTTRTFSRWLLR
mgnify:CR=1 FL=1